MNIERMYKFIVMEHINDPQNKDDNLNDTNSLRVNNDSCGDRLFLKVEFENNIAKNISWNGTGCSLSMSVCSIMSKWLLNNSVEEIKYKLQQYENLVLNKEVDPEVDFEELLVMANQLPARYKCATLFKQGFEFTMDNMEVK